MQKGLMQSLLSGARIRRLMDEELLLNGSSYTVTELVNDVQDGIFSELTASTPKIDMLRRNLQRAYLDHLKAELSPKESSGGGPVGFGALGGDSGSSDFRAVARLALQRLRSQIPQATSRTKDTITLAHLQDCEREIDAMLAAKK
jgi:hypothetical protein